MIVNATLSNNRAGTAVILDAAAVNNHVDPEVMSCDSNSSGYCLRFLIGKRKLLDF